MGKESVVFWLLTFFIALLIDDSATQMMMLDNSNVVGKCDVMCATAFAESKASCVSALAYGVDYFASRSAATPPALCVLKCSRGKGVRYPRCWKPPFLSLKNDSKYH